MWIKYNPNPKKRFTGDCVIRAISLATNSDWKTVYTAISMKGAELGDMMEANHVWAKVLLDLGWKCSILIDDCPECTTVKKFCEKYPYGTYILATGKHAIAVRNGDYYDSWDSGDKVPIYYFYRR